MARLADDFEDGVQNVSLWEASYVDSGTSYAESGGNLVITPAPNTAGAYAGYRSQRFYDLRGQRIVVEVAQVASGTATTALAVEYRKGTHTGISVENGQLHATVTIASSYSRLASTPYDPVRHRYWAVEERAGQIYFETSSNGSTFDVLLEVPEPFDVSLVRGTLFAGTAAAIATPGEARFAVLNGGIIASAACPASSFVERFEVDNVHSWETQSSDPCCAQSVIGGKLQMSTDGASGYTVRRSSQGFDLRDGAVAVTVGAPSVVGYHAALRASHDNANDIGLQFSATTFDYFFSVGGVVTYGSAARSASEVHLRLREATGTTYFETSVDKLMWRQLAQISDPLPLDDVTIDLQAGVFAAPTTPDSVTFDDLGVP